MLTLPMSTMYWTKDLYNSIFTVTGPEVIAVRATESVDSVMNTLAPLQKVQIRKNNNFISENTKLLRSQAKEQDKIFKTSMDTDDFCLLRNLKNPLT